MRINDVYSGVKLNEYEKEQLREGKAIPIEGISKTGNEFKAHLQLSAENRGVEYIFPKNEQFNRESIGGVDLTKKQLEDLKSGKAIFIEDMKRKDGSLFSSFVKLDSNGNTSFTRFNPDNPGEIYIPKEICGVRITPDDKDTLRAGKPIFLYDMVKSSGEEFSSFVKLDPDSGKPQFSRTEDGFNQRPAFNVPQEIWGVTPSTKERADLQDGKAIFLADMTGVNGQKFSSWMKVDERMGQLNYYPQNPDIPRQNAGKSESVPAARQDGNRLSDKEIAKQEKSQKSDKSNKKSTKRGVS
jgi:hypothetical protein